MGRSDLPTPFAHRLIVSGCESGYNALNSTTRRLIGTARGWSKRNRRRDVQHPAIIAMNDLPVALVHHPVVPVTEQDQVAEVGCPAVDPVNHVVRRAPPRRAVTSRPSAVTAARLPRPSPGFRHDAL